MTNPNRVPPGVPTGGQFATSAKAAADGVDLADAFGEQAPADVEELGVYGETDECRALGVHLSSVDEDGYCLHCGHGPDDDFSEQRLAEVVNDPRYLDDMATWRESDARDAELMSAVAYWGERVLEATDEQHPGHARLSGAVDFWNRAPNADLDAADDIAEAIAVFDVDDEDVDVPFANISDDQVRTACLDYASRYAPAPTSLDHAIDWSNPVYKPVTDVQVGDRLHGDQVVTEIIDDGTDAVYLHVDGMGEGTLYGAQWFPRHRNVMCHSDRVDLSDPDWFEVEAARATKQAVEYETILSDGTYTPDAEHRAEIEQNVRRRLTRAIQPRNISPLHHDGPNADPRIAHGRAKVGDDVIFSSPMHGDDAYTVLGKRARVDVAGHDGTQVVWAETGEVEYVLKSVTTGKTHFDSLTDVGWRRIPAPGDNGPGAEAQRLDR